EAVGMVLQKNTLFSGTIKENLLWGNPNATDEEIYEAARAAQAHDFIMALPDGYHTNLGDGGSLLSGGQRQRISIARAILKNPPILILDEATSALDTESEHLVQDALDKLMHGRTTLVIAHRLSTIKGADLICVMQDGRIIERGTHDELIARQGAYKHLVDMQTF
ncbi:MAG: ATP-binding cassette domain-containing protein, partial [Muribaculaceae bacterium]|nr:ATP-binding cassette domain-containing protein [Muribaculaceae bacterium]